MLSSTPHSVHTPAAFPRRGLRRSSALVATRAALQIVFGLGVAAALGVACTLTKSDFTPDLVSEVVVSPAVAQPVCGGAECCDEQPCPSGATCRDGACVPDAVPEAAEPPCDGDDCPVEMPMTLAPSCDDGAQNGDEMGVDCGGGCPSCSADAGCASCGADAGCAGGDECASLACASDECAEPSCSDRVADGDETDVDCGGSCSARCAIDQGCALDGDCEEGSFCSASGLCAVVSCSDDVLNGDETGIDCGGGCSPCPDGSGCNDSEDCESRVCDGASCAGATCSDRVLNQDETGVDCGGLCTLNCATGESCRDGSDCESHVCSATECAEGLPSCCQPPSCADGIVNGGESDVDCGSEPCERCGLDAACTADAECATGFCELSRCANRPTCNDGIQNGSESSIDCGGSDQTCRRCFPGESCRVASDCLLFFCFGGSC